MSNFWSKTHANWYLKTWKCPKYLTVYFPLRWAYWFIIRR